MAAVRVLSPVAGFSGVVAGVEFRDGVAEVAPGPALAYMVRHGYTIDGPAGDGPGEDVDEDVDVPAGDGPGEDGDLDEPARPVRSASKTDWVAYAVAMGEDPEDAAALTRAELADRYGAP